MKIKQNTSPQLGIDLGSRNVKLCLVENGAITRKDCIETMSFYRENGVHSPDGFSIDLSTLGFPDDAVITATGYGRMAASLSGAENMSELSAHYLGASYQTGLSDYTLLDMGGQDYKVMQVSGGKIVDMATNDKCAASTGRYLENMSRTLGITIDELGTYHDDPVTLSSTCAIFGESELIGLIVRGETTARLAAGVNRAVVERVLPLLERLGNSVIVMTGGVALNPAVVTVLEKMTGREVLPVTDPLHNGAIGCCVEK